MDGGWFTRMLQSFETTEPQYKDTEIKKILHTKTNPQRHHYHQERLLRKGNPFEEDEIPMYVAKKSLVSKETTQAVR